MSISNERLLASYYYYIQRGEEKYYYRSYNHSFIAKNRIGPKIVPHIEELKQFSSDYYYRQFDNEKRYYRKRDDRLISRDYLNSDIIPYILEYSQLPNDDNVDDDEDYELIGMKDLSGYFLEEITNLIILNEKRDGNIENMIVVASFFNGKIGPLNNNDHEKAKCIDPKIKVDMNFYNSSEKLKNFMKPLKEEEEKDEENKLYDSLLCPISMELMKDPVLLTIDGHTYEREEITKWLKINRCSPLTMETMRKEQKIPDVLILNRIVVSQLDKLK